jgi:hypothetical protein
VKPRPSSFRKAQPWRPRVGYFPISLRTPTRQGSEKQRGPPGTSFARSGFRTPFPELTAIE